MLVTVYKVFVGLLLATFVGVGIAAFAPEPKSPEPPVAVMAPGVVQQGSPEAQREAEEFQRATREHRVEIGLYNRNVSAASVVAAIIMLGLSLVVLSRTALFSDGFLLGGILTFGYSVLRGFGAEDNMFRFIIVSIGLVIALALGYLRFIRPSSSASAGMSPRPAIQD